MNVIDAVKSGKPFRRKAWNWKIKYVRVVGNILTADYTHQRESFSPLSVDDLLADDWEVDDVTAESTLNKE